MSSPSSHDDDASERQRRKDLFGDCALVEIIHLHDCLRGALKALQQDVTELSHSLEQNSGNVADLERRVAGRFKVIWSVFRAHSAAEDEFIWPALQTKQKIQREQQQQQQQQQQAARRLSEDSIDHNESIQNAATNGHNPRVGQLQVDGGPSIIEQEEYEEDHADEEKMFRNMDALLGKLRTELLNKERHIVSSQVSQKSDKESVNEMARSINELTGSLCKHLTTHLQKEENHCMPLVLEHLTKTEIHELVGQIMGKRSSDTIAQIMTMAVQNLNETDREEMVRYMKQAMVGTFFERWLSMSGWMKGSENGMKSDSEEDAAAVSGDEKPPSPPNVRTEKRREIESKATGALKSIESAKRLKTEESLPASTSTGPDKRCFPCRTAEEFPSTNPVATVPQSSIGAVTVSDVSESMMTSITSQADLEKLIRVIASNPALTAVQKTTTIQGLRDSVWKSNRRQNKHTAAAVAMPAAMCPTAQTVPEQMHLPVAASRASAPTATRCRRTTPASSYYKKNSEGKVELVWSNDSPSTKFPTDLNTIPLFSASELAPTYHDGATGAVLGCPHYARACKLRHPSSGRLYTCRLCCEQEREMPMKDQDSPLDRYAVTEVLCMRCGALQPAADKCANPKCESQGKPFAKYSCKICNFYDDHPHKNIYHCPFCNVCRSGQGLGIDYRHCMRCNACVSLADDEHHCIPQRLQGSCPVCHESMFESTEPLRGLKCGHVMHLSCFNMYIRGSYTCPLCKKSVEDMKEYFSLLDAAVRMQPMPVAYSSTVSNIHCQDCGQAGQVQYHFVGCKCPGCGSYNTRELGRVQGTIQSSQNS